MKRVKKEMFLRALGSKVECLCDTITYMNLEKIIKFTPELTDLIKQGKKTTTWRLFDDKNLSEGDSIILATRDGEKVTTFGRTQIKKVSLRTFKTLKPEDYIGHEPVEDLISGYRKYYGDKVDLDTEVKIIHFGDIEIF
jgi:hypothetical protein